MVRGVDKKEDSQEEFYVDSALRPFHHMLVGGFALVPGFMSRQASPLLLHFAGSVNKPSELHVWTEQPSSNGREGKERLQHQVRNCQVDTPRKLSPASEAVSSTTNPALLPLQSWG